MILTQEQLDIVRAFLQKRETPPKRRYQCIKDWQNGDDIYFTRLSDAQDRNRAMRWRINAVREVL